MNQQNFQKPFKNYQTNKPKNHFDGKLASILDQRTPSQDVKQWQFATEVQETERDKSPQP